MKVLRVGDPHAKVNNLDEMKSLILFVIEMAKEFKVDRIEILGDLFHTHAVLRLEVIRFWTWALDALNEVCETVVLVGNHDQSGDYNSDSSALGVFALMGKQNVKIIEKPTLLGVFGYVPYIHDSAQFVGVANDLASRGAKVLVCHQTFTGSKYESGIYAPDGIDPSPISESIVYIISGHIHSEQSFGRIIYPGTARWDSVVDANKRKGIWIYTHEDGTGSINSSQFISTENVCSPIRCIEWREGDPAPDAWPENAKVAVELIGSSNWVASEKQKLKGKCSVKTKITDRQTSVTRTAGNSLEHFINNLFVSTMDREHLLKYAKELNIV